MEILLSVSTTPVIGWIAQLLGWIMNAIYWVLDAIHIPNVGLAIIFYTIITYLLLTPLQIKQQKMSKMMSIIQPEIQKIQKKYQGKRDQATQMKIQEETMGLYQKYGISPTGSCLPLLIQLPILFGLYQVIYHIPGYISKVANIFSGLANEIIGISNSHEVLTAFAEANKISVSFGDSLTQTKVIDFLYMLKPNQWDNLASGTAVRQPAAYDYGCGGTERENQQFSGNQYFPVPLGCNPERDRGGHLASGDRGCAGSGAGLVYPVAQL